MFTAHVDHHCTLACVVKIAFINFPGKMLIKVSNKLMLLTLLNYRTNTARIVFNGVQCGGYGKIKKKKHIILPFFKLLYGEILS